MTGKRSSCPFRPFKSGAACGEMSRVAPSSFYFFFSLNEAEIATETSLLLRDEDQTT